MSDAFESLRHEPEPWISISVGEEVGGAVRGELTGALLRAREIFRNGIERTVSAALVPDGESGRESEETSKLTQSSSLSSAHITRQASCAQPAGTRH